MDRQQVEKQIQEILFEIIREIDGCTIKSADAIDVASDFTSLEVTSVDLMEFVLGVETAFDVSVLDNLLPEDLPSNISGWTDLTLAQLEAASKPS